MAKKHLNEGQENYNESKVFIPNGFVGMGNSTKGFNFNSSWGGRWENGGILPYTPRTKNIPSNGKYAKKTKASARDGKMLYFQQGLDFQPKTISANGSELEKLDQLTNWTNYNIAEDGLTMLKPIQTSQLQGGYFNQPQALQQMPTPTVPQNDIMSSLGGVGGIANTAGKLIQGIQQLGAEKKKRKSAEQWANVSDVVAKAAFLKPEQAERKYVRPEDNINTGSEFFPVYGVGTNVLKHGGEIQNTYAPNTLYKNLEYFPLEAEDGISINPWTKGADIASNLITGIGGENAGGDIGGTVGKYAGMAIGGPLGAAIGQVGGQIIGGLIDRNPHKTKLAQEHFNKNMQRIGMADGVQQQYSSYMEDGGELKYVSNDWLPKSHASLDEYRSGGNLKADYTAPTERALQPYALGGDIQTHWGGKAEPISYNPFLPEEGETIMFKGQTHDESDRKGRSGIGVTFGNNPVEVENNEPAVKLNDGGEENNLVVFGNLQIPKGMLQDKKADGRKFKSYIADLSKTEARQNNLVDNSMKKIDDLNVNTSFDKLKLSSLKANVLGANMKLKEIADKKMNAANLQSAINDTAAEQGLVADDLAKGKITKAKNGTTLKAKGGKELEKISQEDYDKLIGMYNKAKQQRKGKEVEEFQKAFSLLLPNRAKAVLEKYPVTNYGRQQGLPATDLASNYDAIFGQRTEQYLPQIEDALNKEITPIGLKPLPLQPINTKQLDKMKTYTTEDNTPDKQNKFDFLNMAAGLIPYLRPSDTEGLDPRQLVGEMYALSHNQLEPVYAQTIQPDLSTPYDISLQDMMPRFEAAKRSAANNPAALAQIEAQEQEYKSKVRGEQFRQNQAMKAQTYAQNRDALNQSKLQNLNILSQQQDKQSLAKSNTQAIQQAALQSIGDKMLQKEFENMKYNVGMNMNNYMYDANGRIINVNPTPNFNIPTVSSEELTALTPMEYQKHKAYVKAYEDKQNKKIKDTSKTISRNGNIVKAFKGY